MSVKHSHDIPGTPVSAGKSTIKQVLISSEEGPHFALRKFTIEPGGGMPLHTNTVEHEQYIVQGSAHIVIGDEAFDVKDGDIVLIPRGVQHSYDAYGEVPFVFLCVVPNEEDTITLVE